MSKFPFQTTLDELPALTSAQMIEVDRAMVEDYHIELAQMMENAGHCLAKLARRRFLDGDPRGKRVTILAGSGGNGGGALVCARRLHTWGTKDNNTQRGWFLWTLA
jgi:NAD(P)H-hydrate epimerase